MAALIKDEGREAYWRRIDPRKCPHADKALREAWMMGWNEAKAEDDGNFYPEDNERK